MHLLAEDIPADFYPASLSHDGLMWSLSFPDFPEIAKIKDVDMTETLSLAEKNLGWAIRKRAEQGHLFPFASQLSTVEGEPCLIKASSTPPLVQEE